MYYICEASTIPWPFFYPYTAKEKETLFQFTQIYKVEHKVELIEHGVDPFLYYRFKNLTPRIARHKDTGELFYIGGINIMGILQIGLSVMHVFA